MRKQRADQGAKIARAESEGNDGRCCRGLETGQMDHSSRVTCLLTDRARDLLGRDIVVYDLGDGVPDGTAQSPGRNSQSRSDSDKKGRGR